MSTQLLAAGACYNSNNVFTRCALQPSECNASQQETYRTSRWLATNDSETADKCSDQAILHLIPALGRCDSAAERFICTSHETACRINLAFRSNDPDCTVLFDYRPVDTPFVRSYYGECATTTEGEAQGKESFCAWQFSECPTGGTHTFQTADEFFAAGTPSCTCDRVHTGACISAADPNDFFCAVTEQVCAANDNSYTYLNAHQVLENLGITCKLCDTVPASPNTLYTHAGACVSSSTNEFRRCALLPEHCSENDEMFVSSRQLEDSSQAVPTAALGCLAEQGLHQVRVGRCVANSDQNICVPDATACKISQSFRPNDDECTLVQDLSSNAAIATTHFGHCTEDETTTFAGYQEGRERYCAWSFQECLSPSAVARPLLFGFANPGQSGSFPQCQCDDVRVGACVSNINPTTDLYCAVGASACDQGYSYQNVRKLEEPSGSNTICHLCQPLPPMSTTTAEGPPPTNPPTSVTMPRPPSNLPTNNRPTPSFQEEFENEYFQDGLEAGAIVGIVFGVLLSSVIFIVAICMFRRGQRQGQSQSSSRQDETNVEPSVATKQSREVENVVELLSPLEEACMEGQTEEDFVPPSKENKVV